MSLHDRTPYELACDHRGRQGLETDILARVIRRRLPDFLESCEAERAEQVPAPVMARDPDREAELLEQREQARAGESRFAEERDCAFALLRWLLPVTVAKRLDGGDPAASLADALAGIEDRLSEINDAVRR